MKKKRLSALCLFACAFFWGTTFAAQNLGAGNVGTFTFLTMRSFLGTVILLPVIFFRKRAGAVRPEDRGKPKALLVAGICCGICLFLGSALQQYGIELYVLDADRSGTSKASFITAMYVVLVPVISLIFGKKPKLRMVFAVIMCVTGLYFLCLSGSIHFSRGDFLILLCALAFSIQIMTVDHFSSGVDGLKLAAAEFFVTGICSVVFMIFFEKVEIEGLRAALPAILYAAVFSNGIAYTLQIVGQRGINPSAASLIMCLESVFGVLSAWVVLHESLSIRQIIGCILMFAAIVISSLSSGTGD